MARRSRSKHSPTGSHLAEVTSVSLPGQDRATQLRAIVAMAGKLNDSLELSELLRQGLEWAIAISAHQQGSIMLSDQSGRNLLVRAVYGQDPALLGNVVRTSESSVAGWVLKHRQHLYLIDQADDFPGDERSYTKQVPSSLVLPLLNAKGKALGVLSLNATEAMPPLTAEDIDVLQAMANLVAVALNDAAIYRTLEMKDRQLQTAATQILKAQEEERKRMAYNIHDGLAQMIAATHQRLQAYRSYPWPTLPEAVADLDKLEHQLRQCVDEVRRVIGYLRPSILDDYGLESALRQFLSDRQQEMGWQMQVSINLAGLRLSTDLENTVFRIVQEATTNVMKHAAAERVEVNIARTGRWLELVSRHGSCC